MSDQQLAALLAREAIRDLPLRYCDCVWRDDIDGIVNLFAADGSFIAIFNGQKTDCTGTAALRDFYVGGLAMKPRPYIHNHVFELTGARTASGRCYLDLRIGSNNMEWLGAGFYEDDYVKVGDDWKFQTRRFNALRMDELPPGFTKS
ncbi:MAG: nuclear transport factor 2 family protein [Proteobacteria bacterium]|jgi:hypothetical protein|nr:nuclear transport factor 2 family protein [Pseudomonadota bacterium]